MWSLCLVLLCTWCGTHAWLYPVTQTNMRKIPATSWAETCGECSREHCVEPTDCKAGIVRDRCGCCHVCGLEESHLCNMDHELPPKAGKNDKVVWHGLCGENLECRVRTDVDPELVGKQSICYCLSDAVVCGSDGKTYSQCQMKAMTVGSNGTITKISDGYCRMKPSIELTRPEAGFKSADKVTLICAIEAYPPAEVTWYWTKPAGGKSIRMPSDSDDVTISIRGGPRQSMFTSYLQIINFSADHEGEYRCVASNDLGMETKSAKLVTSR
ncbi:unnamed protein product [Calicophoron daubneyi]|uniref:Uncharacterized protein n=1 Tax=Calicophoron daubneyi TaxID=300641 RepID=A0AAV2TPM0_CALDB